MKIYLGIDIGTTKVAAVAVDADARQLLAGEAVPHNANVVGLPEGHHEQNPQLLFAACVSLLRRLCASQKFDTAAVHALAITGQVHGLLLLDRHGEPCSNAITWCDQRSASIAARMTACGWPTQRTGCLLHTGYGGALLATLGATGGLGPRLRPLTILDYVAGRLCGGEFATDVTQAASWGICDIGQRCWDAEALTRLGIAPRILPKIRPDLAVLGALACDVGLPPQTTVRLPLGDNQASFFGACGFVTDALLLNLGTGGQISRPLREFAYMHGLETRPLPFGGFLQVGASLCGGRAYALLEHFFRQTVGACTGTMPEPGALYAAMDRLADAAATELEVNTRFAGTRLDQEARGAITGIGCENFTPGALARGVTHGMIRELAEMLPAAQRRGLGRIVGSGNALRKSVLARQFAAMEFELPCTLSNTAEEAAVGAAYAAARAEE